MNKNLIDLIEKKQITEKKIDFKVGYTVKVFVKIVEGNKSRLQPFQGTVIAIRNAGVRTVFTVRKVVSTIGVERTFVLHSPNIEKVEIIKTGKPRRAKLYYLRERIGSKATRIKEG